MLKPIQRRACAGVCSGFPLQRAGRSTQSHPSGGYRYGVFFDYICVLQRLLPKNLKPATGKNHGKSTRYKAWNDRLGRWVLLVHVIGKNSLSPMADGHGNAF